MGSIASLAGHVLRSFRAGSGNLAERKVGKEPGGATTGAIQVASSSFADGKPIPEGNAGKTGRSPELHFSGVPTEAKELVLLCEDPDAPLPRPFVHWLVYNLPPNTDRIGESAAHTPLPASAHEGKNSMGSERYFGPAPPPGHGVHHYHFQVFALDTKLKLDGPVDRDRIVTAMRGHVLAFGETVGTFERA
jgi:Raf kinase inhibitor-like YbhB/YbcL family protein